MGNIMFQEYTPVAIAKNPASKNGLAVNSTVSATGDDTLHNIIM